MEYNKQQLKAIHHPPAPLLILAGAGTGKTTTIVGRIARLIKDEIAKPETILALTYTVKAAENLKNSLIDEVGDKGNNIHASNYHSFAQSLHIEFFKEMGYVSQPEVMNESEIYFLLRENFDDIPLKSTKFKRDPVRAIIKFKNIFDRIRDELLSFEELIIHLENDKKSIDDSGDEDSQEKIHQCEDIVTVYPLFHGWKQDLHQIDFGDMIWNIWNLIQKNKTVLQQLRDRCKHIIVDEFQDNNYALSRIVQEIAEPENSVTVVGDDDQSIYSFRGANIGNVYNFVEHYKDFPNYEKIPLMENYRSDQKILDFANEIIQVNPYRLEKGTLVSRYKGTNTPIMLIGDKLVQPTAICEEIKKLLSNGDSPNTIAILTRTNAQCELLKNELNLEGIPVSYSSDRLFDQCDIKDIVAWINLLADSGWSFQSLIRLMKNKFNVEKAFHLSVNIHKNKRSETELSVIDRCINNTELPVDIRKFCQDILNLRNNVENIGLEETVWQIIVRGRLYITGKLEDVNYYKSIAGINQFRKLVSDFIKRYKADDIVILCRFINVIYEVNNLIIETEEIPSKYSVQVMTIHNAKGREFNTVFIPFLSSASFPMSYKKGKVLASIPIHWKRWSGEDRDEKELHIEEERRLFYVGITRAKKQLILLTTEKRQSNFIKHLDKPFIVKEVIMTEKKDSEIIDEIIGNLYQRIIQESSVENFENAKHLLDAVECVTQIRKGAKPNWEKNPYEQDIVSKLNPVKSENIVLEKPRLSSTSIHRYKECPLKYKYKDIHKIEEKPGKPYFSLGNTIHKVLEVYHKEGFSTIDDLFKLLKKHWNSEGFEFKQEEGQYRKDAEKMLKKYYDYSQTVKPNVFSTEKYFEFDLSNCTLSGKCDRIDVSHDGGIEIIDYKTGRMEMTVKEARKTLQLAIYAMYARQSDEKSEDGRSLGKMPKALSYIMLRQDEPEVKIQLTEEEMENHQEEIESIAEDIQAGKFEAKSGFHCNRCDYKNLICTEWN